MPPIGYNITHDNGVVAIAFAHGMELATPPGTNERIHPIGVDVMKLHLPRRHTLLDFVDVVSDQVRAN